jgi:hypothetical protein
MGTGTNPQPPPPRTSTRTPPGSGGGPLRWRSGPLPPAPASPTPAASGRCASAPRSARASPASRRGVPRPGGRRPSAAGPEAHTRSRPCGSGTKEQQRRRRRRLAAGVWGRLWQRLSGFVASLATAGSGSEPDRGRNALPAARGRPQSDSVANEAWKPRRRCQNGRETPPAAAGIARTDAKPLRRGQALRRRRPQPCARGQAPRTNNADVDQAYSWQLRWPSAIAQRASPPGSSETDACCIGVPSAPRSAPCLRARPRSGPRGRPRPRLRRPSLGHRRHTPAPRPRQVRSPARPQPPNEPPGDGARASGHRRTPARPVTPQRSGR